MNLEGVHILLTYECNYECDHCFVWGSPAQSGTLTSDRIRKIILQSRDVPTVRWIYFEGGEPFLYYAVLVEAVRQAARSGFNVGLVTNAYWATDVADAGTWLAPFRGLVQDLSISSDRYHGNPEPGPEEMNVREAAARLEIPVEIIRIGEPRDACAPSTIGQLRPGESAVMFRGRAADRLAARAEQRAWSEHTTCPFEDLRDPERVHVDPLGYVHICQGITIGNVFRTPLKRICEIYDPEAHPVTGPLLDGGPAALVRRYALPHPGACADACHLCFVARRSLRGRYPDILGPDQMYGVPVKV